jgi:microcystin-dependent protein
MLTTLTAAVAPDVPVGTILLFAGDCTNSSVILQLGLSGWMPCDGSVLLKSDYPELYNAIGLSHGGEMDTNGYVLRFNLPNLIGRLARGVNGSAVNPATGKTFDPEAATRTAAAPNGNTGNNVGSFQGYATALPVTSPFITDSTGAHTHQASHLTSDDHNAYYGTTKDMSTCNGGTVTVPTAGAHQHSFSGGDAETMPVTIALFHIIKYN